MANSGEAYSEDKKGQENQPQQNYPPQQGYAPQQGYPQQGYPMQYHHGSNVVVPVAPVATTTVIAQPRPNDYFIFSVLTCLFCFWPTGIAALLYSWNSKEASAKMDYAAAESNGRMAKIFSIVSLVIGLIWMIAVIIYVIVISVHVTSSVADVYTAATSFFDY